MRAAVFLVPPPSRGRRLRRFGWVRPFRGFAAAGSTRPEQGAAIYGWRGTRSRIGHAAAASPVINGVADTNPEGQL